MLPSQSIRTLSYCILGLFLMGISSLSADENFLELLTHEDVKTLPPPELSDSVSLYEYDVKMSNDQAYLYMQHGYGHLLGMWDFQAYRFFLEAIKLEPDSIFSTAGLALSLMLSDGHLLPQNQIALKRLESLINNDTQAERGTAFEITFAEGVLSLAKAEFKKWRENLKILTQRQDKGWILPALLNAYFSRDKYTAYGEPTFQHQEAIEILNSYSIERPNDPGPLTFYITSQVDNPNTRAVYYTEILPCARKLSRLFPNYPYYHLLHGYCEMRCGDPFLAEQSYRKAEELYEKHRESLSLPWRNCKPLIDAKIGLITSYTLQENFTQATKTAQELLSIKLPKRDYTSLTEASLLWEAKTFPLRIACMEGDLSKMKNAATSLKQAVDDTSLDDREPYHYFWDALQYYVFVRSAINAKSSSEADKMMDKFLLASEKVLIGQKRSVLNNDMLYWNRAATLLKVLENELKMRYELTKEKIDKANVMTWATNAIDAQEYSKELMPPLWLFPMETLKAEYLQSIGENEDALLAYDQAYNRFPNHIQTTQGIEQCLRNLNRIEKADKIKSILEKLKEKKGN